MVFSSRATEIIIFAPTLNPYRRQRRFPETITIQLALVGARRCTWTGQSRVATRFTTQYTFPGRTSCSQLSFAEQQCHLQIGNPSERGTLRSMAIAYGVVWLPESIEFPPLSRPCSICDANTGVNHNVVRFSPEAFRKSSSSPCSADPPKCCVKPRSEFVAAPGDGSSPTGRIRVHVRAPICDSSAGMARKSPKMEGGRELPLYIKNDQVYCCGWPLTMAVVSVVTIAAGICEEKDQWHRTTHKHSDSVALYWKRRLLGRPDMRCAYLVPGHDPESVRTAFQGTEEVRILVRRCRGHQPPVHEHDVDADKVVCGKAMLTRRGLLHRNQQRLPSTRACHAPPTGATPYCASCAVAFPQWIPGSKVMESLDASYETFCIWENEMSTPSWMLFGFPASRYAIPLAPRSAIPPCKSPASPFHALWTVKLYSAVLPVADAKGPSVDWSWVQACWALDWLDGVLRGNRLGSEAAAADAVVLPLRRTDARRREPKAERDIAGTGRNTKITAAAQRTDTKL
uniref:Uncharacterized protein n=1 Tax=Mycena chlorophos TaxID=658473 RepID=A0ABQ0LCT9_MYCCL|nr:predicted protein [Mycena chlorophos]